MIDEDLTAARLKGYNCLLKFKDGEELFLKSTTLADGDEAEIQRWFLDVEKFINGCSEGGDRYFPMREISLARDSVKYVRRL